MNKQTQRLSKIIYQWMQKHVPSMHATPLFDKNLVVWSNQYASFTLDYKNHILYFCSIEGEWEMKIVSSKMWHYQKEYVHTMLDEYMKQIKMFFSDSGMPVSFDNIRSAVCRLYATQVPDKHPLPKIYKVDEYLVDAGYPGPIKINRFLRWRGCLTKNNNVTAYHNTIQSWGGNTFPKDLFHPIKYGLSSYFGRNDYAISKFEVWNSLPF